MPQLIPAILAKTREEFISKLELFDGVAPLLHVDVMDGVFVPNTTWFDPIFLNERKTQTNFELHLMVNNPLDVVHACEELSQIQRVIWHIEAPVDHLEVIRAVRHQGWQTGVAINPTTSLDKLSPFIDLVDEVLVMGSMPGFSGKPLELRMLDRAAELHAHHPELPIGFDIGVNAQTIPQLIRSGVERLCTASAIFGAEDPKWAYGELQRIAGLS